MGGKIRGDDRRAWGRNRVTDGGMTVPADVLACFGNGCFNTSTRRATRDTDPEQIAAWFRRQGWAFDIHDPRTVRCPGCVEKAKGDRHAGKLNARSHLRVVTPTPPAVAETAKRLVQELTTGEDALQTTAPEYTPRPLTPDERTAVRDLLDKHFNTESGRYGDGMSDQEIGRRVNVPWAKVTELRKVAYGEIKEDPAIEEMRLTLARQERELAGLLDKAAAIEGAMRLAKEKLVVLSRRLAS